MFSRIAPVGQILIALCIFTVGATAQESPKWSVEKSSGEVWVVTPGAQPVALSATTVLGPGDQVRTGKGGRVHLARGSESIWISPNTIIGIPREKSDGLATTILQTSGSILIEAEKRDRNHFEVETPYLVAVVKGTQFRVTMEGQRSNVDVVTGRVEVTDLRSGQFALVLPGQSASVSGGGAKGLSLFGPGDHDSVKQGTPRPSRAIQPNLPEQVSPRAIENAARGVRINAAIGEVKLDFPKVTKGIVRASENQPAGGRGNRADGDKPGVRAGQDGDLDLGRTAALGNGVGASNGGGKGAGNGNGGGSANAAAGNGGGNGNGAGAGLGNAFGKGSCNGKGKGASC